jgi:hypothetical protein
MARPGLTQNRKFRRLARALGSDVLARGSLELLWDTAYESGDDYLGDTQDVELAARWAGESGVLCKALLDAGGEGTAGFIEQDPERPGFRVHDLFENAPEYVQKRMMREIARNQRGQTISELRRQAGRKGRAAQLGGRTQTNGGHLPLNVGQASTNGDTPAPAPAPESKNPSSEQKARSDEGDSPDAKKVCKQPSQEACRLASLLKAEILANKADYRITPAQERPWALCAQRMLEIDKRNPEEIAALIRWVQRDEFWASNVVSMDTLRERFDQLQLKQHSSAGGANRRPSDTQFTVPKLEFQSCPFDECDGSSWYVDRATRARKECRCAAGKTSVGEVTPPRAMSAVS